MAKRDPFTFDPSLQPWERQPNEPKAAHTYFRMGLELPVRQRTVKQVSETAGISPLRAYQYSSEFHWSDRWRAFDAVTFAGWFENLAADRMAVAYDMAEQVKLMLELSGQHLAQLRDAAGSLPPIEFTRLMGTALRTFVTIYGAAPQTVHHSGPGGGPVAIDFDELDKLTPLELEARVLQLTGQSLPVHLAPPGSDR